MNGWGVTLDHQGLRQLAEDRRFRLAGQWGAARSVRRGKAGGTGRGRLAVQDQVVQDQVVQDQAGQDCAGHDREALGQGQTVPNQTAPNQTVPNQVRTQARSPWGPAGQTGTRLAASPGSAPDSLSAGQRS